MSTTFRVSGLFTRAVYIETDRTRWRVHDCTFGAGRFTRCAATPNSWATHRVFVAANGVKKSYRFTRGESRELTESRLEAQLAKAGFLGAERFDPHIRDPERT